MKKITQLAFMLTFFASLVGWSQTTSEPPDFPGTGNGPDINLITGVNTVNGSVTTPNDGQDRFRVVVPAGLSITSASFTIATNGQPQGFMTFNSSETVNFPGGAVGGTPYASGTYTVLIAANFAVGNNWSMTFTVAGTAACDIAIGSVNTTAPSCPGGADGTVTINATCTTCTGLEYSLDNVTFQPSNTFTRGSGTYTAYVRDTGDATCNDSQTAPVTGGLDNTAPMITCPANQTGDVDGTCMFAVPDYTGMATATDNCTTPIITQNPVAGSMVGLGVTTITLTANDGNGQTTNCTFTLTVEDNEVPVVTCIADDTRDSDAGVCTYTVIGTEFDATFTDNCMSATITNDVNNAASLAGAVFPLGDTVVTWTVNDGNGQMAMCTTTVTVEDNEAPVITCIADDSRDTDMGVCTYTVIGTEFDATFTDNCTSATITNNVNMSASLAGAVLPLGDTIVTWTVDDGNGQMAMCTTTVTVEDNEAPVITCIADDSRDTDMGVCEYTVQGTEFDATFTDNCMNMSATITNDFNMTASLAGAVLTQGETIITWTIDDGNGQMTMCTTTITVEDNEDPIANCAAPITLQLDDEGNATIQAQPVPVTSVSGSLDTTDPQFARPNGNGTTCSTTTGADHFYDIFAFSIDAADVYTFSMPNNIGPDFYFLLYEGGFDPASPCVNFIEGNDDTNGTEPELNLTLNLVPGDYELITTSFSGNAPEGPYTYSVSSTTGGNVFEAGAVSGLLIDENSSDNCGIASVIASQTDFTCSDIGDNTVILTITDVNGNVSTCSTVVTIEDDTPVIISSGPVDIFTGTGPNAGDCETVVNYDPVTVTSFIIEDDNCFDNTTISVAQTGGLGAGASFPIGTTVEEYTITDSNGNETVYTFEINISDTTLPEIDCPDEVIVSGDEEGNYMIEDYSNLVSDNCSSEADLVITQEPAAGTVVTDPSTTEVTLAATDEAGNMTTCSFDLIVDETLGVDDLYSNQEVVLYPNPTNGQIIVEASKTIDLIAVYDMRGRLVVQESINALSSIVDITSFDTGIYFVNITSGTSVVTKRVIKQ